ncbi:FUSC family protein [Neobacillus kokaensis]|uniref:FUSC family protein n=1 Tax=Neobacillus kokaensis TaxID=2759023 RepID=A0ABQ3NB28_9BACI|nr:FUSC family protein [Neobacillus kokaensis]GHI01111.1 FUSC family protein [Neobacillus kokaensis]
MNKKTIISNTILFVVIVAFVMLFSTVFGKENTLIGVTTITAMLMLLERDLTNNPISNTMKLILLNLAIGIAAFLADMNMWLAIPVNFTMMIVISYSLIFNLRNPLYLPFSLQYLFLLASPVGLSDMPLRLLSLIAGAVGIMALQMVVNKNKMAKNSHSKIRAICTSLVAKIEKIKNGEGHEDLDKQIAADISTIRSMIYDKREEDFYLTEEGQNNLNLSASLERINQLLNKVTKDETEHELLNDTIDFLQAAADSLDNKKDVALTEINDSFGRIFRKYKQDDSHSLIVLRMLNNMDFLRDSLVSLKSLEKEHVNIAKKMEQIPTKFQNLSLFQLPRHTRSIKVSYAVRMALGITIGSFLVDYFHLQDGRWMLFTILSVIQPVYELSNRKMRDRIFATLMGAIIVTILFTIFQGHTARSILILIAGYLMSYIKEYRYSTILVTFSAIGAAALITDATEILTINRIIMVISGVVLALIINKWIFPYKMEDSIRDLEDMNRDTIREMLQAVHQKLHGTDGGHEIKNLLIITTMIENRMKLNKQVSEKEDDNIYLAPSAIYELYCWIEKYGVSKEAQLFFSSILQDLRNHLTKGQSLQETVDSLKRELKINPDIEERLIISLLFEITLQLSPAADE